MASGAWGSSWSESTPEPVMQTPLWIFHGSEDNVTDLTYSKNIYNRIVELGGEITCYTEYPGAGHDAWTPAWQESTLVDWFFAQRRGKIFLRPDYIMNLKYSIIDSHMVKLTWDKVNSERNTKNWIWYLELYKNEKFMKDLDPNQNAFIDSSEFKSTDCRYTILSVNYYFRSSIDILS